MFERSGKWRSGSNYRAEWRPGRSLNQSKKRNTFGSANWTSKIQLGQEFDKKLHKPCQPLCNPGTQESFAWATGILMGYKLRRQRKSLQNYSLNTVTCQRSLNILNTVTQRWKRSLRRNCGLGYLLSFLGGEVTDVPRQPGLHSEPNSKGDPRPQGEIGHENPWICISGSTVFYRGKKCLENWRRDFISGLYKVCPVTKRYWTLQLLCCFALLFPKPELLGSDVPIRIVLSFCACFQNLKSWAQSGVQHALDTRRCFNPFESWAASLNPKSLRSSPRGNFYFWCLQCSTHCSLNSFFIFINYLEVRRWDHFEPLCASLQDSTAIILASFDIEKKWEKTVSVEREIQNRKTREKTNTLPHKSTDIGRLLAQLQHPFSLGVLTVEFIIDTAILQFYIPYHSFEIYHFISFVFFYAPTAIALRSSAIVRFRGRIALGLSLVLWGRFVLDCQKVPRKVPPRFHWGCFTKVPHLSLKWLFFRTGFFLEGSANCSLHLSPSHVLGSKLNE